MEMRGYMVEVEFDGETLTARGTNAASRVALAGPDHKAGDVVIPVSEIASVEHKKASRLVNGHVTVTTTAGKKYQLHFRRKQAEDFDALADALDQKVAARP